MALNHFADEDEAWWSRTVDLIDAGLVIPIVGSELLQVRVKEAPFSWAKSENLQSTRGKWGLAQDEWLVPWESWLASALAKYLVETKKIDASRAQELWPAADEQQFTLSELTGRAVRAGRSTTHLRTYAAEVAKTLHMNPNVRPSPLLVKLAEIAGFNFFVTTGSDQLMEKAILEATGRPSVTLAFDRKLPDSAKCDVPADGASVVYHLFGLPSPSREFVLSDDDVLEWVRALQAVDTMPPSLLDKLHTHELLFLGCGFPDWLSRFFLRLTKRDRLSARNDGEGLDRTLAERALHCDRSLYDFLNFFSEGFSVFDRDVESFVERLDDRWCHHAPVEGAREAEDKLPLIFLSYGNQDEAVAWKTFQALKNRSLRVLFDKDELKKEPGIDWDRRLVKGVQECAFFVPIISKHALSGEPGRYLHKEWQLANKRVEDSLKDRPFIVPTVCDNTDPKNQKLGNLPNFTKTEWWPLANDEAIKAFADGMTKLVHSYQTGAYY